MLVNYSRDNYLSEFSLKTLDDRYLIDGENSLLFEPDNVLNLVHKIKLLSDNKTLKIKLSKNARQIAESFTWDNRVQSIYKHIDNKKI